MTITEPTLGYWSIRRIEATANMLASQMFGPSMSRDDCYMVAYDAIVNTLISDTGGESRYVGYPTYRAKFAILNEVNRRRRLVPFSVLESPRDGGDEDGGLIEKLLPELDHAPSIEERLAVRQVLDGLPADQRAAVIAMAEAGDHQKARALMGINRDEFRKALNAGRQGFNELWHEGEAPAAQPKHIVSRRREMLPATRQRKRDTNNGVTYLKRKANSGRPYMARSRRDGKRVYLGVYATEAEAAAAVRSFEDREEQPAT